MLAESITIHLTFGDWFTAVCVAAIIAWGLCYFGKGD
jgi:hypothetical protein